MHFSEWISPESKLCHVLHWFFFLYCILFDIAFEENLLNWSLYCPRRNFSSLSKFLFKQVPSPHPPHPHPPNEAVSHGAKGKKKRLIPQKSQSILRDIFSIVLFLDTELPWYIINTEFLAVIKWQAPHVLISSTDLLSFFEEICWTKNIWVFVFTLYFPDYFWPSLFWKLVSASCCINLNVIYYIISSFICPVLIISPGISHESFSLVVQ